VSQNEKLKLKTRIFSCDSDKIPMRHQGFFLVFIMCLTLGLTFSYHVFQNHFSDRKELGSEIAALKKQKERQALEQALLQNQLEDLKAHAFQSLGQKTFLAWDQSQWQSSLRSPASLRPLKDEVYSRTLFSEAKSKFRQKAFAESAKKLRQMIDRYPSSKDIVEAHFLLAESLYLTGQQEATMDLIDEMMTRYPESELTGFIMMRMGQILEKKSRRDEALEVYQTISLQFPGSKALRAQIESRVRGLRKLQ
jgi:TolA-binding protein